jgi:transcription initiation factor TFIID subunit 5
MFVYCHLELVAADVPELAREFHRRFASDHELAHGEETIALAGLASPAHLRSDPTALKLKQNRMPVRCCQYTFDLLVKYLHVANQMALLSILNKHVAVTVTDGDPAPEADEAARAARSTITGIGPPSFVDAFNAKKTGRWGVLEQSVEVQAMDEFEEERARAEKEEGDGDDEKDAKPMSKRSKAAAEKAKREAEEKERLEREAGNGAPRPYVPTIVESEIPVPELAYQTRLDAVEDARYRAELGAEAGQKMPSVAFYTFTHAHGFLNCATVSRDAAIVAGGFADSAVRVWDMNKAVPGGADVYETDPESRARRAAKDAEMDAPAAERGEGGGDATMVDAEKRSLVETIQTIQNPNESEQPPTRGARLARPTPSTEYVGHASAVHGVSLSPGDEFLLSCSRDTTVRLWSLELKTCLAAYRGHEAPVWDVTWCDRGHYFATASYDKTARVWAMDSPSPRRVMVGHLSDVDCVAWHPNANYIATGSADRTVRMWDVASGECVRIFVGHAAGVRALALSPDGKSVASAADDGEVLVWDLGTARQTHAFVGHRGPVYSLDYAGGGRGNLLASGGADETVRLWDTAVGVDLADAAKKGQNARKGASGGTAPLAPKARGPTKTTRTKSTPVCAVSFTGRNLLMAMGARAPSSKAA